MRTGTAHEGVVAAVDLGASSGRVVLGRFGPKTLRIEEVHRFSNEPVSRAGGLHTDIDRIRRQVVAGLRAAAGRETSIRSVAVDGWGVDFGLLDAEGSLVAEPRHYRDARNVIAMDAVHTVIPPERLYERTGIQVLPFNTIYQLSAAEAAGELEGAATMLLLPDLISHWLAGGIRAEATNASTTGLLDARHRAWATDIAEALRIPDGLLPPLHPAGEVIGEVRPQLGLPRAALTLAGSHDTASAVVGIPATDPDFAYVVCGTWGLVGVELGQPVLTEASRVANFTNELGVDDRVRFLRNVTGLWLLQESMRHWKVEGEAEVLASLLEAASELPSGGPTVDPNNQAFLAPGDIPARIADACRASDQRPPDSRPAIVRCILDSLAHAFAQTLRQAVILSGSTVRRIHLVGGGSRNELLCQLTADASELPVIAGPIEATAIGNLIVQARAHGLVDGDLETLRGLIEDTQETRRYDPRPASRKAST